ncbi:cytochrome P450 [Nocardia neocaledoniensis NBRC 108232]|uniref:Cytochrome P450 n=1 Tax=Nocardia neocaledoniensis TaxID=236511 RepID=A0A317N7T8_9NOCA|nr:cytochrome P450 [Nocardia neocaledoniensis]PWV71052.1 cytochrome P450 [Nocardia neocaledoniensis]GEM30280.1 cytochrome P450 [Nocardia neocaledoniensis NBRC 108232]
MTAPNLLDVTDIDGIDFAFGEIPDLHTTLADLRSRRPYAIVPFAGVRAVLLLTNELVSAAFKDEPTFPAAAIYRMTTGPVLGRTLQCMEGTEHRIARGVATPPFRRNKVSAFIEPILEPLAHELIDRFAGRGHAELVAEFTTKYPVLVISRLLGLPVQDEATVHRWAHDLFYFPMDPEAAMRASREFTDYVTPILAERRREPGDDLISMLVTESAEGEYLDDEQVLSFLRLLFPAGADTTMLALGNTLSALLTHPDQMALLESDIDEHTAWAIWEGLRWEPPVGLLPRACPEAVDWHGIPIPPLTPMIFSINAALRDPAVFERPDEFDITRRQMTMLAFGQGPHSCAGNWLAIAELTVALQVLLRRLPGLRLDEGASEDARVVSQVGTALRGPNALRVSWNRCV